VLFIKGALYAPNIKNYNQHSPKTQSKTRYVQNIRQKFFVLVVHRVVIRDTECNSVLVVQLGRTEDTLIDFVDVDQLRLCYFLEGITK